MKNKVLICILFICSALFSIPSIAQNELVIPDKTQPVYGNISFPEMKSKKAGVVIVSHGFGSTQYFGNNYKSLLNELGYIVYSFDYPNGSIKSQSGNNTRKMTIPSEKECLKNVIAYFQKRKDVDKSNIVLLGENLGGLVSALVAAELKDQIRKVVLLYPSFNIADQWSKQYPYDGLIPDYADCSGTPVGKEFLIDARKMKPFKVIGDYKGDVLIVHGDKNLSVPVTYSERALDVYENANLKVIPNARETFNASQTDICRRYISDFLLEKKDEMGLEYMFELKVLCGKSYDVGKTARGIRRVIPIIGGVVEGKDIRGKVLSGGADYQLVQNDGKRTELEAIYDFCTNDGVNIHVRNVGVLKNDSTGFYFRAAPRFEAPEDSKYAWLNDGVFVCKPEGMPDYISLKIFRVK